MSETGSSRSAPSEKKRNIGAAKSWWRHLHGKDVQDGKGASADRAAIARLKRASIAEAIADAAVFRLHAQLYPPSNGFTRQDASWTLTRTAVLAMILARVKVGGNERLARVVGVPAGGKPEDAKLKPQRLRRMLAARGDDGILLAFRRVVALAEGKANVADLTRLVLDWDHVGRDAVIAPGERVRAQFVFDYYGAGEHAPGLPANATEDDAEPAAAI